MFWLQDGMQEVVELHLLLFRRTDLWKPGALSVLLDIPNNMMYI